MPDRDEAGDARNADQEGQSAARLRALAREGAREAARAEALLAFDSVGIDIETRAGREAHRDLLNFVRELKERHDERGAQVRKGIIEQAFGLAKWLVVAAGLGLGTYFGFTGKAPHP